MTLSNHISLQSVRLCFFRDVVSSEICPFSSVNYLYFWFYFDHKTHYLGRYTCVGRHGDLKSGVNIDEEGHESVCTTFVLLVEPRRSVDVCKIRIPKNELDKLEVYS